MTFSFLRNMQKNDAKKAESKDSAFFAKINVNEYF